MKILLAQARTIHPPKPLLKQRIAPEIAELSETHERMRSVRNSPRIYRTMPPHRGQLLRDYLLARPGGRQFMLSDFRGKQNLVLIFLPQSPAPESIRLVAALAEKSSEVRENETRVVVVVRPEQLDSVVSFLDHLEIGASDSDEMWLEVGSENGPAVYVTDKFREVFQVFRADTGDALPSADDLLGWVRFVAMQCPECHPPEWPADAL